MKRAEMLAYLILILAVVAGMPSVTFAATDAHYAMSPATDPWGDIDMNADYVGTYGDESSVTYTLPASFGAFSFYGQSYDRITADTNGNIWFDSRITGTAPTLPGAAHSFSLDNTGRGPVIAAWHNDLSSYYYGGVFIQHKTGPERVVIAWQTETYTNEGLNQPNSFEVVLYPSGEFRLAYKSFATSPTNKDAGSGCSKGDGTAYTSGFGSVFTLAGKSFQFTPLFNVDLTIAGNGGGSVVSNPAGINCPPNCSANFLVGTDITLTASANGGSGFVRWSGGLCTGTGQQCGFTLSDDTATTATFAVLPTVDFTATLSSSFAPARANFTDSSTNATSWDWYFDDGTTSTLRNPDHVFRQPGTYHVAHSASNEGGSASTTHSVTLAACSSQPVKVGSNYYATLQSAYDAAASGALIQVLSADLAGSLQASRDISVTIAGGYLCGFPANPPDATTITGAPRITSGTVKMRNIRIR